MRLAEHVEHTTDVRGMLENMSAEQWQEWCVKDQIEPIGHTTHMVSLLAFLVSSYLMSDSESVDVENYMPWLRKNKQPQNAQAKKMLAAFMKGV